MYFWQLIFSCFLQALCLPFVFAFSTPQQLLRSEAIVSIKLFNNGDKKSAANNACS